MQTEKMDQCNPLRIEVLRRFRDVPLFETTSTRTISRGGKKVKRKKTAFSPCIFSPRVKRVNYNYCVTYPLSQECARTKSLPGAHTRTRARAHTCTRARSQSGNSRLGEATSTRPETREKEITKGGSEKKG